jgi:hypothetical protein
MTLARIFWNGFAAVGDLVSRMGAVNGADAAAAAGEGFVLYTLDVTFTPYGPEFLYLWLPTPVDRLVSGRIEGELV